MPIIVCRDESAIDIDLDLPGERRASNSHPRELPVAAASTASIHALAFTSKIKAQAWLRKNEAPIHGVLPKRELVTRQIKRLTIYIDEHLASKIRTVDLAARLDLSVSHFCRAFKQVNGVSPRVFIVRRRIAAACSAMVETNLPLTEIAHAHGFCDQPHFNRAFQQTMGIAPQDWRRLSCKSS